jgi:hypothetical protein
VAGNVFFEIVFSSISFDAAPVFSYFILSSLSFLLATIVIITSIIIPVALSNALHGSAKETLLLKFKPLMQLAERCFIGSTFAWTASLLVWGPNKFPPFSWMTYTLPTLALLLMTQQLLFIRRACINCDRERRRDSTAESELAPL